MASKTQKREVSVPLKYAGKWIAWNEDHTKIVASGDSFTEAHEKVQEIGQKKVWFDKVPARDEFLGGALFGG